MKKAFIQNFDVFHERMDIENPLTIGNGNFAFTSDVTGLQTFYEQYNSIPLGTMTNFIWAKQKGTGKYPFQEYYKASTHKPVYYMTDVQALTYDNYRDDWFKFDLFKLVFLYKGKKLKYDHISNVKQQLSIYDGMIYTSFTYENALVNVITKIPQSHNVLHIKIKTTLKDLQIKLFFLIPSSSLKGYALKEDKYALNGNTIRRKCEVVDYTLYYNTNMKHKDLCFDCLADAYLSISLDNDFSDDNLLHTYFTTAKEIDTMDEELNRRMVLSLYLMKVNTLGIYPPAETGLTCNSWYGKFHLEMHLWHHLGIIRFGLYDYVIPSIRWYLSLLETSRQRALEQGYSCIRFPKMTDPRGRDTPSNIGCLLIWQMPHLFVMLEEIMKQSPKAICLKDYFPLLIGLIDFMSSFYYWKDGSYHLDTPMIPANENVEYFCDTPIFEECYTIHAFTIFLRWVKEYQIPYDMTRLQDIIEHCAPLEVHDGCYEAFFGCRDTYTKYKYDHPMMIGMYSYFKSSLVKPQLIKNTLNKILSCWSLEDTWGWDFPMLAMTAYRLGDKSLAISILKMKALKNEYLKNGHNPQYPKKDLPIYLPGNGALLLAISHIYEVKNES